MRSCVIDLWIDVTSLPTIGDGLLIWQSTLTVIVLGKNRKKGGGASAPAAEARSSQSSQVNQVCSVLFPLRTTGAQDACHSSTVSSTELSRVLQEIERWHLDGSVGRQYGVINGDLNPIHLFPFTSRMFGFKRPIAHALFLVAKAEAAMRNNGNTMAAAKSCTILTQYDFCCVTCAHDLTGIPPLRAPLNPLNPKPSVCTPKPAKP